MAKRSPERPVAPRNVERANRDEEREARVAEMVTKLRRTAGLTDGQRTFRTSSNPPVRPRGK